MLFVLLGFAVYLKYIMVFKFLPLAAVILPVIYVKSVPIFCPLFVKLTKHLLAKTGLWLAMKGVLPEQELAAQQFQRLADEQDGVALLKIEVLKVAGLDAERHLVFLNLK